MAKPTHISELIDKEKWRTILQCFVDVLQLNIFVVDAEGHPYLTPSMGRFGWKLLSHSNVGINMFGGHNGILEKFKKQGFYLEYHYPYMLHSFAVPIDIEEGKPVGFLVLGPVILNKRLENSEYEEIARQNSMNPQELLDLIHEVKVVSFINLKAILDLLYEVSHYIAQLNLRQAVSKPRFKKEALPKEVAQAVADMHSSLYLDELLTALLDTALKMTRTECGSIMILNDEAGELTIKISRGIDKEVAENTRVKIGEGISGLAAQENAAFIINGDQCDNRIKKFLKRPEVKQAYVAPIVTQNRVFGVINLHTKNDAAPIINQNLDIVQQLSRITSIALNSLQTKP